MSGSVEKLRPLDIVFEEESQENENVHFIEDVGVNRCEMKAAVSLTLECQHRNRMLWSTKLGVLKKKRASTLSIDYSRDRKPSQSFLMTYSAANIKNKLEMEICPELVSALHASTKQVARRPSFLRSKVPSVTNDSSAGSKNCLPLSASSSSPKASKSKKKVRFSDKVTIHRISIHKNTAPPPPETFIMIMNLKEVWAKLDLDRDKHLNMLELRSFVDKVWEDEDVESMMKSYAAHPEKGLCFGEWCAVLKEEEGEMDELIDDLYTIFVEESEDEDDEKAILYVS